MMFRPLYHFLSFLPSSWLMVMHTYLLVITTAVRGRADRPRQTGMRQTGEKCNYRVHTGYKHGCAGGWSLRTLGTCPQVMGTCALGLEGGCALLLSTCKHKVSSLA